VDNTEVYLSAFEAWDHSFDNFNISQVEIVSGKANTTIW